MNWLAYVSLILLLAVLVVWLTRRFTRSGGVVACPRCEGPIPISDEPAALRCSRCAWPASRQADVAAADNAESPSLDACRICGQTLSPSVTVRLWDDQDYCEICVAERDATLPEYAGKHNALSITMRMSFWRAVWGGVCMATVIAVGVAAICALFTATAWSIDHLPQLRRPPREIARAVVVWFLLGWAALAVLCVLGTLAIAWLAYPRTVVVRSGFVLINPPSRRLFRLPELRWADASSKYDQIDRACWPPRRGVLLFTRATRRPSPGVMVGRTEEDRQRWAAFLALAGVPRQPVKPWRYVSNADKDDEAVPSNQADELVQRTT